MNEKQLQALIKKTAAKAERAKPKRRPSYDPTLDATRTEEQPQGEGGAAAADQGDLGDADQIFKEMKKRSF